MSSIRSVLVPNRGEIARRVFRTCRRLGIGTVAVHSEPDAAAPFVAEADLAVALGGATPAESYLRVDAIIDAAKRSGADAVHPGYGFLAENAGFARAVLDAGLVWIGPSPKAIEAMGSKTRARELMRHTGVPVLPGRRLCDEQDEELAAAGAAVGYPLLVKASAGGGGKGMRLVASAPELESGVAAARREAAATFGDDTVFLERYAPSARHVEIQIMGDTHGRVASLFERDCSVQRRYQKVIEEAPSPALGAELRERMSAAAVAAGKALSYVGAGTVEFLVVPVVDGASEFFFLEVNTRLQVEHPVTELVTGLDLVELQLAVAEGSPLPERALCPELHGHAIEARLYAEDPARGFLPAAGLLSRFEVAGDVRVDTGVAGGSEISPYYDPMIAKVIAHGQTRDAAARKLADALARARVHGLVTNRDFLVRVLRHPEFLSGDADTSFLDRHEPAQLAAPLLDRTGARLAAAAAALAGQARRRLGARVLANTPSGWRNNRSQLEWSVFSQSGAELRIEYAFDRAGALSRLRVDDTELERPRLRRCTPGEVDLEVGAIRRHFSVDACGGDVLVNAPEGQLALRELRRFPDSADAQLAGSLCSPMPGSVVRVLVQDGAEVASGQPLLVIEAMKMEQEIVAPEPGVIALKVAEGSQVQAGAVLAVVNGAHQEEPAPETSRR